MIDAISAKAAANRLLAEYHYLGPTNRGAAYVDDFGAIVVSNPSSRHLPQQRWREVIRWCLPDRTPNAGSRQWASFVRWARGAFQNVTTIVSYSDPAAGHDGALYRATGWLWAPTWQRLRPPPTGQGSWDGLKQQGAKDRWVYLLQPDDRREAILRVNDESIMKRAPWASYVEPIWSRGRPVLVRQNERYARFVSSGCRPMERVAA
jgi:hypothetical protein